MRSRYTARQGDRSQPQRGANNGSRDASKEKQPGWGPPALPPSSHGAQPRDSGSAATRLSPRAVQQRPPPPLPHVVKHLFPFLAATLRAGARGEACVPQQLRGHRSQRLVRPPAAPGMGHGPPWVIDHKSVKALEDGLHCKALGALDGQAQRAQPHALHEGAARARATAMRALRRGVREAPGRSRPPPGRPRPAQPLRATAVDVAPAAGCARARLSPRTAPLTWDSMPRRPSHSGQHALTTLRLSPGRARPARARRRTTPCRSWPP